MASMTEQEIISNFLNRLEALTRLNSDSRPRLQLRVPLPLDVAATISNPTKVSGVFTGFYVESATDTATTVNLSTTSPETANLANFTTLRLNDASGFEQPVKDVYLTWTAQPGKTVTIVFYTGMNFIPGSKISVTSGGVAVSDGSSSVTAMTQTQITNSITQILASDSNRISATVTNMGPMPCVVGGSTVQWPSQNATTPGTVLGVGESIKWQNVGALYAQGNVRLSSPVTWVQTTVEK